MTLFWIIFILISLSSLITYLVVVKRVNSYIKDHSFIESHENCLLNVISLKHVMAIYLLLIITLIIASVFFIIWNANLA